MFLPLSRCHIIFVVGRKAAAGQGDSSQDRALDAQEYARRAYGGLINLQIIIKVLFFFYVNHKNIKRRKD